MPALAGLVVLLAALLPRPARAVPLDGLDLSVDWQVRAVRMRGNRALSGRELQSVMVTKPRRWFVFWRARPEFDPVAFRTDLERLRRLYQSRGYYHARIEHDLELPAEGNTLVAVVTVDEGSPVRVEHVEVELTGEPVPDPVRAQLLAKLPIKEGDVFTEDAYDKALVYLHTAYRERGYARVQETKWSQVDLERDAVTVAYRVESGPTSTFGTTEIVGTRKVELAVVQRELVFEPGDDFSQSRIDRTRRNLESLGLFRSVRIDELGSREPIVDMRVEVEEALQHEVRFGIGYDTEEQVRGLATWRHYNFLGGARQLGFTARASLIERTLAADFLQPHFPGANNRTRLLFLAQEEDEDTFTLDRTRVSPRFEWQATARATGSVFYRAEYDSLSSVKQAVKRALPGAAPDNAILSGLGFGFDWNATDDLLDPSRGFVATATVEPVGGVLGGDLSFVRAVTEGRFYYPLVRRLGGAARIRLGTAEPLGDTPEIPLYERFYAGGINSVRGYGRRRLGPLVDDEPIGGRSVVEGSLELRHPITEKLGAAVFVDAGQVALETLDFPFGDLRYGSGFGLRYQSPVGPLRVDLAFPAEPPPGDARWQVHLSLGATF